MVKATLKAYRLKRPQGDHRFPLRGYILHNISQAYFILFPTPVAKLLTLATYLSYECFLRVSELCTLTWGSASWATHHLSLYLGKTKNDPLLQHPHYTTTAPQLAHMLAHVHDTVANQPNPNTPVIPFNPTDLNQALQAALQHLNSNHPPLYPSPPKTFITWHSLKHGHAVDLALAKHSLPTIMAKGRWHTKAACSLYLYFQSNKFWPPTAPLTPKYLQW